MDGKKIPVTYKCSNCSVLLLISPEVLAETNPADPPAEVSRLDGEGGGLTHTGPARNERGEKLGGSCTGHLTPQIVIVTKPKVALD